MVFNERSVIVPFDKSVWGTPGELHQRLYSRAANGETCTSYYPDGRYNIGGWSTYPVQSHPGNAGYTRPASGGAREPKQ